MKIRPVGAELLH